MLIDKSTTNWDEPEWGFQKGEDKDEKILDAIREYVEETGHRKLI